MINNDTTNPLERYFNSRNTGGAKAADYIKQIKERRAAINGTSTDQTDAAKEDENASKSASRDKGKSADANLSPEERRQKEIKAILDEVNKQDAAKAAASGNAKDLLQIVANGIESGEVDEYGFPSFLNDLPIFDQFKTDLMNAFNNLDGATAGSISAQFELNYSSVQMIANEFGGYEVTETNYSFKLDLNYLKAASGADKNSSLSELLGGSKTDQASASSLLDNVKDYFSPANTSDRILDFATSFFPMSDQFKKGGDTEEAREEFAGVMRDAIQKGFDQAMGKLGKVPSSVQSGIDETHRLTFQGIDDFVKYGMGRGKDQNNATSNDVFSMLQQFSASMTQSYSKTTYSYTPGATSYGTGPKTGSQNQDATTSSLDAEA